MSAVLTLTALVIVGSLLALSTFASPGWPFRALGLVLGVAPFAQLPGLPGTVLLALLVLCWCSLATAAHRQLRPTPAVLGTVVLVATAGVSLLATGLGGEAISDFAKWALATSVLVPLTMAGAQVRAGLARAFVFGASTAAGLGIVLLLADPSGRILSRLGLTGLDRFGGNQRLVVLADGSTVPRLTSVWLDPNVAGLMMTGAVVLAVALLRGRTRVVCTLVLVVAIALTLSRAAFGSLVVAAILLVVAGRLRGRTRLRLGALSLAAGLAALAVPGVLTRLRESFGSSDVGASARWDALVEFPGTMAGDWFFGKGWGLPELVDGSVARLVNYPANAPLLSLYRGGIVVAVVFVALLLVLALRSWRQLRGTHLATAAYGAGVLGLLLVAAQLDFAFVTITPCVVLLGVLLALDLRDDEVPG